MEHLHRRGKGIDVVIGIAEQTGHEYGQQGRSRFPPFPMAYWAMGMMETGSSAAASASAALMRGCSCSIKVRSVIMGR